MFASEIPPVVACAASSIKETKLKGFTPQFFMQFFPMNSYEKYRINVQSSLEKDEIKHELFSCATGPLSIHCVMLVRTVSVHPRVRTAFRDKSQVVCINYRKLHMTKRNLFENLDIFFTNCLQGTVLIRKKS